MDVDFDKVEENLGKVEVKNVVSGGHVGEVDSAIRTVKESGRGIINMLPYSCLLYQTITHLIYF